MSFLENLPESWRMKRKKDSKEGKSLVCSNIWEKSGWLELRLEGRQRLPWPWSGFHSKCSVLSCVSMISNLALFWFSICRNNWGVQIIATSPTMMDWKNEIPVLAWQREIKKELKPERLSGKLSSHLRTENVGMTTTAIGSIYVGDKSAPAFRDDPVF